MTSGPRVEQSAELRIYGRSDGVDLDADELGSRLRRAPTSVRRRGESLAGGRVRECTLWTWRTPQRAEFDSVVLVREVLDAFEPVLAELDRAKAEWGVELVLGLVIYMHGSALMEDNGQTWTDVPTPALSLPAETVQRLARLGCDLDVDQYVDTPTTSDVRGSTR